MMTLTIRRATKAELQPRSPIGCYPVSRAKMTAWASLWLPASSKLQFRAKLQAGDRIRFAVGCPEADSFRAQRVERRTRSALATSPKTSFRLSWRKTEGERQRSSVLDRTVVRGQGRGWTEQQVEIGPEDAGRGLLMFETVSISGDPVMTAAIADPRIIRSGRPRRRPNVLLYVIDTLRADRLSCYGGPHATSPRLDEMAQQGFLFEASYSVASWTRPSTASILTGLFPLYHGANGANALSTSLLTMAELLRGAGYSCWAAVSNVQVSGRGLHFEQGYHRFISKDGMMVQQRHHGVLRTSRIINDVMIPWIESNRDEPFFLYLHSLDPHSPYRRHEDLPTPFAGGYDGVLRDKPLVPQNVLVPMTDQLSAEDVEFVKNVYDEEIRFQDDQFRRLFAALETSGLWDETIVIITSDHGEEFMEHGGWDHREKMWEELLRVPLVMWIPPKYRDSMLTPPVRVSQPVSAVDIMASLIDLLDLDDAETHQGTSFIPLLRGQPMERDFVYGEEVVAEDPNSLGTVRQGRWKLIWEKTEKGVVQRLFDLETDPGEQVDVAADHPDVVAQIEALRDDSRRDWVDRGFTPLLDGARAELDSAALEELRRLGYIVDDPAGG